MATGLLFGDRTLDPGLDLRHLEHEIIHPKLGIQEIATLRDKFSSAAVGRMNLLYPRPGSLIR